MLCCAQLPRPEEWRILSGRLEVRDWIRRTSVRGPVDPWGSLNSQELKIDRENAVEKRRESCTNAGICLWVFLLGAQPLLSRAGVRTFRHGHLQPPQPLPRTGSPCTSFSWWMIIWLCWASVGPAPPSPASHPRRCPRCVLPSLGLFCHSPASARVLWLLQPPCLSPLCSHFS